MRLKMHRVPCSLLKSGVGCINPAAQYKKVHSGKIWGVSGCTCMRSLARSKASPCCWSEATNFGAKIPAPPAWVPHLAETTAKHRGTGEHRHPATPLSKVCKRSKTVRTLRKFSIPVARDFEEGIESHRWEGCDCRSHQPFLRLHIWVGVLPVQILLLA